MNPSQPSGHGSALYKSKLHTSSQPTLRKSRRVDCIRTKAPTKTPECLSVEDQRPWRKKEPSYDHLGCDFHPTWQQVAWVDTGSGETAERKLEHSSGEARVFYTSLSAPALIGVEAT